VGLVAWDFDIWVGRRYYLRKAIKKGSQTTRALAAHKIPHNEVSRNEREENRTTLLLPVQGGLLYGGKS